MRQMDAQIRKVTITNRNAQKHQARVDRKSESQTAVDRNAQLNRKTK